MFDALDDAALPPSSELMNFTNRSSELQVFRRVLELESPPPVLMFHGPGGSGKSWLLRRFREVTPPMPIAYLDLDRSTGGTNYADNYPLALAELRRQFSDIDCPQFDLAYTWLRVKEGVRDEPLFQGAGLLGATWEFIHEAGDGATSKVPGAGLVKWLVSKAKKPISQRRLGSSVRKWLDTDFGKKDFLYLKAALPQEIYPELGTRLLFDLHENLPARQGNAVRGVLFVDGVEALRGETDSEARLVIRHDWLQNLYQAKSGLLLVLAGRDRLTWRDRTESDWSRPEVLEQHLVGGLSGSDARVFLNQYGITDPGVQEAILRVSLDSESVSQGEPGYLPYALGLCADTCRNLQQRGAEGDPKTFDMPADGRAELTAPFLRSLAGDGTYAVWLHQLALTPRFDETAARAAFDPNGAGQDAAWLALQSYSFLKPTDLPGWSSFHIRMKEALVKDWQDNRPSDWQAKHGWWGEYWGWRNAVGVEPGAIDLAAVLSWYHLWQLNPEAARSTWQQFAERELRSLNVVNHAKLIEMWTPCDLLRHQADPIRRWEAATVLDLLYLALRRTPLGDPSENLRRSIECCQAVLRVRTETAFPQEWAITKLNLGNTFQSLHAGDRGANLERAIECYQAALRVYTEGAFPQDWAKTQNNLAAAYQYLPTGDRGKNLQRAIACYQAALRVRTEATFPKDWADTHNNLALAYASSPTGDRGENLQQAIACHQSALRVCTEASFPLDWALTLTNFGLVEKTIADEWQAEWGERGWDRDGLLKSAKRRLVGAIAMFKSLGENHAAARCQVSLDQLGRE